MAAFSRGTAPESLLRCAMSSNMSDISSETPEDQGDGDTPDRNENSALEGNAQGNAQDDAPARAAVGDETAADEEPFDAPVRDVPEVDIDALVVNLDGYEGPLDILLELARTQKVDIRKISMVALVDQYLEFVEAARQHNLELAADYLVMASWLAYLKSKLLLPKVEETGEAPTADEMAARLAFQLQRLEAMRNATERLLQLPRLNLEMFPRGCPEGVRVTRTPDWQADLVDLLKAYTAQRVRTVDRNYEILRPKVFSLEDARERLTRILGSIPEWSELRALSPLQDIDAPERSVVASAFHAALEFAKNGKIDLRQMGHFEPIYVRQKQPGPNDGEFSEDENGQNVQSLNEPENGDEPDNTQSDYDGDADLDGDHIENHAISARSS